MVEPYVYRPVPALGKDPHGICGQDAHVALEELWAPASGRAFQPEAPDQRELARKRGLEEGEQRARVEYEKALAREREALAAAVQEFVRQRNAYFRRVETEVVQLALAIARKILHREAQVDPLLLSGVVRVALERVATGTSVRLRVHPEQAEGWRMYFARMPDLQPPTDVVEDAGLERGQCLLETALGCTDLSLETQLKEIEQGFFDLLAAGVPPSGTNGRPHSYC